MIKRTSIGSPETMLPLQSLHRTKRLFCYTLAMHSIHESSSQLLKSFDVNVLLSTESS